MVGNGPSQVRARRDTTVRAAPRSSRAKLEQLESPAIRIEIGTRLMESLGIAANLCQQLKLCSALLTDALGKGQN